MISSFGINVNDFEKRSPATAYDQVKLKFEYIVSTIAAVKLHKKLARSADSSNRTLLVSQKRQRDSNWCVRWLLRSPNTDLKNNVMLL